MDPPPEALGGALFLNSECQFHFCLGLTVPRTSREPVSVLGPACAVRLWLIWLRLCCLTCRGTDEALLGCVMTGLGRESTHATSPSWGPADWTGGPGLLEIEGHWPTDYPVFPVSSGLEQGALGVCCPPTHTRQGAWGTGVGFSKIGWGFSC